MSLARAGAHVIVHGRDAARTARTAAAIRERGGQADEVLGDLKLPGQADAVAEHVLALGGADILVNNAGGRHGPWTR